MYPTFLFTDSIVIFSSFSACKPFSGHFQVTAGGFETSFNALREVGGFCLAAVRTPLSPTNYRGAISDHRLNLAH